MSDDRATPAPLFGNSHLRPIGQVEQFAPAGIPADALDIQARIHPREPLPVSKFARNIKRVDNRFNKMGIDEHGYPQIQNKKTGKGVSNGIMTDNDGGETTWFVQTPHPNGAFTALKELASQVPDAKIRAAFWVVKDHPREFPTAPWYSKNLFPSTPDSHWVDKEAERAQGSPDVCCNCHRVGHRLLDCVAPFSGTWGDIFGCPLCNQRHAFDTCINRRLLKDDTMWEILGVRRAGKPMIRSDWPVFEKAVQLQNEQKIPGDQVLPWSRQYAQTLLKCQPDINDRLQKEFTYREGLVVCNDNIFKRHELEGFVAAKETGAFEHWKTNSKNRKRAAEEALNNDVKRLSFGDKTGGETGGGPSKKLIDGPPSDDEDTRMSS
ncbi:hypothetical protein GGR56DRAFT_654131 [Xylariaceae sp. FL0804]|nr:hypothetical protein GGR56DRAFT_654131 [Xylariaceae sp. FL0804]